MGCPRLVGYIDLTLGSDGPYPNPDLSEIYWGGPTVRRYAYPVDGSGPIETFTLPASLPGFDNVGISLTPDGALWWTDGDGEIYRRADPTGAGSDVLEASTSGRLAIAYSNHDGNLYVVRTTGSSPYRVYRLELDGTLTLLLTTAVNAAAFGNLVRAAGRSIWVSRSITGAGRALYRYDIDANTFTLALDKNGEDLTQAVDHQGNLVHSDYPVTPGLRRIDDDEVDEFINCPATDGADTSVQGGAAVPGNPGRAVMSLYLGVGDFDSIWEWAGGGRHVGKVGRGGPRA